MDVMVIRIVGKEELARIPPQPVATVVVYGFESRNREQQSRLSDGHERNLFGNGGAKGIKNEAFYWVVVKSTKSIRGIKTMMVGVEVAIEPVICVHGSVPKILPSVNHKAMITISKMFDRLERNAHNARSICKAGIPHQYIQRTIASPFLFSTCSPTLLPSTSKTPSATQGDRLLMAARWSFITSLLNIASSSSSQKMPRTVWMTCCKMTALITCVTVTLFRASTSGESCILRFSK